MRLICKGGASRFFPVVYFLGKESDLYALFTIGGISAMDVLLGKFVMLPRNTNHLNVMVGGKEHAQLRWRGMLVCTTMDGLANAMFFSKAFGNAVDSIRCFHCLKSVGLSPVDFSNLSSNMTSKELERYRKIGLLYNELFSMYFKDYMEKVSARKIRRTHSFLDYLHDNPTVDGLPMTSRMLGSLSRLLEKIQCFLSAKDKQEFSCRSRTEFSTVLNTLRRIFGDTLRELPFSRPGLEEVVQFPPILHSEAAFIDQLFRILKKFAIKCGIGPTFKKVLAEAEIKAGRYRSKFATLQRRYVHMIAPNLT